MFNGLLCLVFLLLTKSELVGLLSLNCNVRAVCHSSFTLPLGRLYLVIVALTGHLLYYSRLSLSRSPRNPLKCFEISVPRHIRFVVLRKK